MGFTDWVYTKPASAFLEFAGEVEEKATTALAEHVQTALRTHLDPGIDLRAAQRVSGIRAAAEGNRIVITEGDALANAGVKEAEKAATPIGRRSSSASIESLFTMSSGVPEVDQSGGGEGVVFRRLREEALFGEEQVEEEVVRGAVQSSVQQHLVDSFEGAMHQASNEHPERGS